MEFLIRKSTKEGGELFPRDSDNTLDVFLRTIDMTGNIYNGLPNEMVAENEIQNVELALGFGTPYSWRFLTDVQSKFVSFGGASVQMGVQYHAHL